MSITTTEIFNEDQEFVNLEVELDEETHTLLSEAAVKEGITLEAFMQRAIENQLAHEIREARKRLETRIGEALPSEEEFTAP